MMLDFDGADRALVYNFDSNKIEYCFSEDYPGLLSTLEGVPFEALRVSLDLKDIIGQIKKSVSGGVDSIHEVDGMGIITNSLDYEGKRTLATFEVDSKVPRSSDEHFHLHRTQYYIYENHVGICVAYDHRLKYWPTGYGLQNIDLTRILHQRYITVGELSALRLLIRTMN